MAGYVYSWAIRPPEPEDPMETHSSDIGELLAQAARLWTQAQGRRLRDLGVLPGQHPTSFCLGIELVDLGRHYKWP